MLLQAQTGSSEKEHQRHRWHTNRPTSCPRTQPLQEPRRQTKESSEREEEM